MAPFIVKRFGKKVHPDTARIYLNEMGFSHKVPRKKMVKADPVKQEAFARSLEQLERTQGRDW